MSSITLEALGKTYPGGTDAVSDVNLTISDGEIVTLVGPSGCGKSTLLRLIAGLETPTAGRILLDGADVTRVPPQGRDLAMVFQSYALYPHLTVRGNLSFGLRVRGLAPADIARRAEAAAAMLGIDRLLDRKPAELSGGQRQRVALGRAIVREPCAFLLDEPLSNLDPSLRAETRTELSLLLRRLRATMVYITHDQEEAMTLGSRMAVMRDGKVVQVGAPLEIFRRPATSFVAGFVGSPAMNLIPGTLAEQNDGGLVVCCGSLRVPMGIALPAGMNERDVLVGVRPQDLELTSHERGDLVGRVEVLEPLGSVTLLHLRTAVSPGALVRLLAPADVDAGLSQLIALRARRDALHVFDRQSGERLN